MFTKQSLAEKQNNAWRAYYFFIRTVLAFALPYASPRTICNSSALKRLLTAVRGHLGRKTRTVSITQCMTISCPIINQINKLYQ